MMNKIVVLIMASFIAACSNPPAVHAKPSAPVTIEYSVPKNISAGTQVTTVIRFIANTDMQRLVVSAAAYSGLELISGGENVAFDSMQRGEIREIEVSISLLNEVGYLSVFATTTDLQDRTQSKSIAIRYGAVGEATIQKMKSQNLNEDSSGEKLILMPGQAR